MPRSAAALDLKGRMLAVTRVRVIGPDPAAIEAQLAALVKQMPQAVKGMAVVIDSDVEVDLSALLKLMRAVGMQPLAVSEGPLADAARAIGMAVVSRDTGKGSGGAAPTSAPPAPPPPPAVATAVHVPARVVADPVRSGQQVYAEGGDLIVLSTVSPGAEVIADGCVHVYGKLAGRAVAGARGDVSARIFCRRMEAELLAIAGVYAVAEQIKGMPRGQAAQAYLDQGQLKIEPHPA